ncbi:MAG: Type 1 glutamine amidotransferase-like domain-containing protein [Candidatus Gracilibacteria bacterium]|jgi:peptidase E
MTKKIVAIGGGEIAKHETLAIDKRIIKLTGEKHPKVLFIPTASSELSHFVYSEGEKVILDSAIANRGVFGGRLEIIYSADNGIVLADNSSIYVLGSNVNFTCPFAFQNFGILGRAINVDRMLSSNAVVKKMLWRSHF